MRHGESSPWFADPQARAVANQQAVDHLLASPSWASARGIALFVGVRHEVDTWPLIERAWSEHKVVFLPRVDGASGEAGHMEMHRVETRESLRPGPFGLLEPSESAPRGLTQVKGQICIIVPGLAFCESGDRLGQGGGFYDRFLAGLSEHAGPRETLGLGYEWQVLDSLPSAEHDRRLDALVTERGFRACSS